MSTPGTPMAGTEQSSTPIEGGGEGSSPPAFTKAAPIRPSKKLHEASDHSGGDNKVKGETAAPPAPP